MNDYLKCVVKNKFTLIGYILLVTSIILFFILPSKFEALLLAIFQLSVGLLGITAIGLNTLHQYRRVKNILQKNPNAKLPTSEWYCSEKGIQLAQEEIKRSRQKKP